jgi:hypothetical protein
MPPLRYVLVVLVSAASIILSFVIPGYLGRGAEWLDVSADDAVALAAFQDGYRLERGGNLEGALAKYRSAEKSNIAPVHDAGRGAADRVSAKLNALAPVYGSLRTLADWNLRLRLPLILTGALVFLFVVASGLTRREGTEIHRFSVMPEYEADFSIRFDRLLNEEIARIARVFRSDQLRRIGAAVTMSGPKADSELSGLETRAMAAIRQGELKSIIGFWLAELVRQLQNIGFRPEYVVSGTVVIRPDEATASAQIIRAGHRGTESALDASSAEIAALEPPAAPSQPGALATPVTVFAAADRRQDAQHLAALAAVLACKFFIHWLEMESTKIRARSSRASDASPEMRPGSWQTVHDYVRTLSELEDLR